MPLGVLAMFTTLSWPATVAAQGSETTAPVLPDLNFTPDADAINSYDKYFYFHRAETEFATAYADIQECDNYARGLGVRVNSGYALGGALGTPLGNAISDAIYGSAARRALRRVNMRNCMGYKGYTAYGLPKSIWEQFNFEEGNSHVPEDRRQQFLRLQARAASGPEPRVGRIEE